MITIKLLAWWYVLSAIIYSTIGAWKLDKDFSRRGANIVFLLSQGLAGLLLWALS